MIPRYLPDTGGNRRWMRILARVSSEIETTRAMMIEPVEDHVSAGGSRREDKRPRTVLLVTTSTSIVLIIRHTGTFPRPEYIEEVDLAPRVVYKETESEYLLASL